MRTTAKFQHRAVDITAPTAENSPRGYARTGAAGAFSAAARVFGAVALDWGSPPLETSDAQHLKQLLLCRSEAGNSTRYAWVHVDHLRDLSNDDAGAGQRAAVETFVRV